MNDEQSSASQDTTWDSFEDTGPSVYEDALFQRRFALSGIGDIVTAGQVNPEAIGAPPLTSETVPAAVSKRPERGPGAAFATSDTENSHSDEAFGAASGPDGTLGVSEVSEPVDVTLERRTEALAMSQLSEVSTMLQGTATSDTATGGKTTEAETTADTVKTGDTVQDYMFGEEAETEATAQGPVVDPVELAKAASLLALAADEYMKEQADVALRKEPRPIALVQAQTFVEAVEAAFTAPAPGDIPTGMQDDRAALEPGETGRNPNNSIPPVKLGLSDVESEWFDTL